MDVYVKSTVIETFEAAICSTSVPYPIVFPQLGSAHAHATLKWLDLTHDPKRLTKCFGTRRKNGRHIPVHDDRGKDLAQMVLDGLGHVFVAPKVFMHTKGVRGANSVREKKCSCIQKCS